MQFFRAVASGCKTFWVVPASPSYENTQFVALLLAKSKENKALMEFLVGKAQALAHINKRCAVREIRENYFDPHCAQQDVTARGGYWKAKGVIMDCGDSESAQLVHDMLRGELAVHHARLRGPAPVTNFVRLVQREFGESFIAVKTNDVRVPKLSKGVVKTAQGPKWSYTDGDATIETGATMVI